MNTVLKIYSYVYAGIPAPAGDDGELFDLASHLIQNPKDTMFVKVSGDSMIEKGINDGDILIIDREAEPRPDDVVVALTDDGYTVKTFERDRGRLRLVPASPNHGSVEITENTRICGVATFAIHRLA
jgi:SOS-response transcriptional repressor LexA